jgi:hypothetical protein
VHFFSFVVVVIGGGLLMGVLLWVISSLEGSNNQVSKGYMKNECLMLSLKVSFHSSLNPRNLITTMSV